MQKLEQQIENQQEESKDNTLLNDAYKKINELEKNVRELRESLEEAQQVADSALSEEETLKMIYDKKKKK